MMKKLIVHYYVKLSTFELVVWSTIFLYLASTFASITNFNFIGDSFFTNPYVIFFVTIFLVIFGGTFLGELIFRFFRYLKNK